MITVHRLFVENYRSIRRLSVPLARLNVFVGENGAGKTNLYRALELVQTAAAGVLGHALAAEGGLESASWAGPRRRHETSRIVLGCEIGPEKGEGDGGAIFRQSVELGAPAPVAAGFKLEPQVKEERLAQLARRRSRVLLERKNTFVKARDADDELVEVDLDLLPSETALAAIRDPGRFPDIVFVRDQMRAWRFHHSFRTDPDSPLRRPCLAVTTPTLAPDGADLAAAFATLAYIREDTSDLDAAVADAFPGARLVVPYPAPDARFGLAYAEFPERVFDASELSDGTLRLLALAGALFSYRPAALIALNEPETSLHPDLMPALGRLIARAARRSQVWVVTHSEPLAAAIEEASGVAPRRIHKEEGETKIEGLSVDGEFDDAVI